MLKNIKRNKSYYFLLLCMGVVFYILNFYTPFMHDDYAYCYYYDVDSYTVRPTDTLVTGVWQMLVSMWHHYLCVNGRFVPHIILQSFCAFLGKGVFNLVNTIVFLLLIDVIRRLSSIHTTAVSALGIFLVVMCVLPFPGQTMLWMAGGLNYLWPATATLWFLYCLTRYTPSATRWYCHFPIALGAILIAWTQESITAPVAAGLFLYFCANRKEFSGYRISATIGYCLGAALIVFSPGTFARMERGGDISTDMDIIQFLFIHLYSVVHNYLYCLLPVLAILLGCVVLLKKEKACVYFRTSLYGWMFCMFTLFLWVLGMFDDRVYFGISCLSLIIVLRFFAPYISKYQLNQYAALALVAVCAIPSYQAIHATKVYSEYNDTVVDSIVQSPEDCIIESNPTPLKSRFVYDTTVDSDRLGFHNRVRSFYYHKNYVQALPSPLYKAVIGGTFADNLEETDIMIENKPVSQFQNFWVLPLDECPQKSIEAVYNMKAREPETSRIKQVVHYLFNSVQKQQAQKTFAVESDGIYYLLMPLNAEVQSVKLTK